MRRELQGRQQPGDREVRDAVGVTRVLEEHQADGAETGARASQQAAAKPEVDDPPRAWLTTAQASEQELQRQQAGAGRAQNQGRPQRLVFQREPEERAAAGQQ